MKVQKPVQLTTDTPDNSSFFLKLKRYSVHLESCSVLYSACVRKTSTSLLMVIFISFNFMKCGSFKSAEEPWEGISGNTLRVYISEFFPFEENVTGNDIQNLIKERLNQRATLIIASNISINLDRSKITKETDIILNKLINDTISKSRVGSYDCSENNLCTAFGEYDITEILQNLESINTE